MTEPPSYFGQQGLADDASPTNSMQFHIQQALMQVRTTVPVKVIAVHGGGTGGAPATVDVQPMVNQIDGQGNKTQHGVIYGVPCTRCQSGGAAIVMDPSPGDIGAMSIADRDISSLKANDGGQSNPGSFRRHNLADGIYTHTILSAQALTKFIHVSGSGISAQDEFGNKLSSSGGGWNLNGMTVDQGGNVNTPGDIVFGGGISGKNHVHIEVQPGSGLSGPPET